MTKNVDMVQEYLDVRFEQLHKRLLLREERRKKLLKAIDHLPEEFADVAKLAFEHYEDLMNDK